MNIQTSLLDIRSAGSILNEPAGDRSVGVPFHSSFAYGPLLEEVLHEIGPLPGEALFMGQAEDGLPILLNLHDPFPGPLLIVGEPGCGKTGLLHMLAEFVVSTHTPGEIQFAVITKRVGEWQERLADTSHCVGVFSSLGCEAKRLVHSLAAWISAMGRPSQSVLLLIDGFADLQSWDDPTIRCLHQILTNGPEKRVWPIASLLAECDEPDSRWESPFGMRILSRNLCHQGSESRQADGVSWFSVRENGKWIHFRVPDLGY